MTVYLDYRKLDLNAAAVMVQKYNKNFNMTAIDEIERAILEMANLVLDDLDEVFVTSMGVVVICTGYQDIKKDVIRHLEFSFDASLWRQAKFIALTDQQDFMSRISSAKVEEVDDNIISMIADEM